MKDKTVDTQSPKVIRYKVTEEMVKKAFPDTRKGIFNIEELYEKLENESLPETTRASINGMILENQRLRKEVEKAMQDIRIEDSAESYSFRLKKRLGI